MSEKIRRWCSCREKHRVLHLYQVNNIDSLQLLHCSQTFWKEPVLSCLGHQALHYKEEKRKGKKKCRGLAHASNRKIICKPIAVFCFLFFPSFFFVGGGLKRWESIIYSRKMIFCKYLPAPTTTIFWLTKSDNGRPWALTVPSNPASATPAVPYNIESKHSLHNYILSMIVYGPTQ